LGFYPPPTLYTAQSAKTDTWTADGKACEFESTIFTTQVFFLQAISELDSIFTGKPSFKINMDIRMAGTA